MIPLKINNKKYKIKAIDELNTKQFIELSKLEDMDITKYVAWQTGLDFSSAFFSTTPKSLDKLIGTLPDITKLPTPVLHYVSYKRKIETVGQRHQVEESNLSGLDLLVLCLAVAQAQNTDIEKVYKLRDFYLKKPWLEILPAGFFFFKIYKNGRSIVDNFLVWLLDLIRIKVSKSKLVLKI